MIPGKGFSGGEDRPVYEIMRSLGWKRSVQAKIQIEQSCDEDSSPTNSLVVNPDDEYGQRSDLFTIPPQDQAVPISYSPLDEDQDEIRLVTLLPVSKSSPLVNCALETVSLKSVTPEYKTFILESDYSTSMNSRKMALNWANLHGSNVLDNSDHNAITHPTRLSYRFTWGDYAALSYVWGDPTPTQQIVVNGKTTLVGRNLEVALRALSKQPVFQDGLKLWVDAICINQDDCQERGHQIRKMRDIYGNAQIVIAWLGEEYNNSNKAMDLVHALSQASIDNNGEEIEAKLRIDPEYLGSGCWLALEELMSRDFWFRLWIIQEIVLGASSLVLQCGTRVIPWMSFCQGIGFLYDHLWYIKDDLRALELGARGPNSAYRPPGWSTLSLHLVYQDLWALSQREARGGGDNLSFSRLLDLANATMSQDDRDKVYGLVGLMDPTITKILVPDYRIDVSKVYVGIARIFIRTYGTLEPIGEGNPWGGTNTPSWAADWTWDGRSRHRRPETCLWGPGTGAFWHQRGPLPIVRAPVAYNASGEEPMEISFSDDGLRLTCRGFLIDEISGLTARENGYFKWLEQSMVQPEQENTAYGNSEAVAKALYRTLVMDRVAGGKKSSERHAAILNLPCKFQNAREQFKRLGWRWLSNQEGYYFRWERWREANRKFRLMGRTLDEYFNETIPDGASEYDYTEVYSLFDRTCKGRRLMTTKHGYLGWAPDNLYGSDEDQARVGDKIGIIFGCSKPIVIRPQGNYFLVLGEAYVEGLMDGEALEFLKLGQCEVQDFLFC
jgi:hypothetical protein